MSQVILVRAFNYRSFKHQDQSLEGIEGRTFAIGTKNETLKEYFTELWDKHFKEGLIALEIKIVDNDKLDGLLPIETKTTKHLEEPCIEPCGQINCLVCNRGD